MLRLDPFYPILAQLVPAPTKANGFPLRSIDPSCRLRGWRTLAAEVDFLRQLGLGVVWQGKEQRYSFPRVSAACDYFMPARFEDLLEIRIAIEKIGTKSVSYAHEFRRGEEVLARGKITSVCCRVLPDHRLESTEIPPEIRAKLEAASG